jgi:hypothetical protein
VQYTVERKGIQNRNVRTERQTLDKDRLAEIRAILGEEHKATHGRCDTSRVTMAGVRLEAGVIG